MGRLSRVHVVELIGSLSARQAAAVAVMEGLLLRDISK
jgi:hypothetical protein